MMKGVLPIGKGLSPPTRGSHLPRPGAEAKCGSIPAHAGEPVTPSGPPVTDEVYPRPRGGAVTLACPGYRTRGLSPPTRGSLLPAPVAP